MPPKSMNRQSAESRAAKSHLASSTGVYVPPSSNGINPGVGEREMKLFFVAELFLS